jgi:hypothetical protein
MIYFNSQHYKIDFKQYLVDISFCRRIIYLAAVFVLTSRAVLGSRAPARPGRICQEWRLRSASTGAATPRLHRRLEGARDWLAGSVGKTAVAPRLRPGRLRRQLAAAQSHVSAGGAARTGSAAFFVVATAACNAQRARLPSLLTGRRGDPAQGPRAIALGLHWVWAGRAPPTVRPFRRRSSASRSLAPASRRSPAQDGAVRSLRRRSPEAWRGSPPG